MVEKVQVLGRTGRNSLQKSTTFNVSGKRQSQYQRLTYLPSVPGPIVRDPNFKDTVLLLHGDNTSGANNTLFLDNSGTTYVPFSGTFSNYFNGSSYISTSYNSAFSLTGDFTIELWINYSAHGAYGGLISCANSGAGWSGWQIIFNNTNNSLLVEVNNTTFMTSNVDLTANVWNHVAWVRSGSTNTLYINGVNVATASSSATFNSSTSPLYIGVERTPSFYITGYISNVRVLKGTALYTSNFTPPTTPLTAVSGTTYLTCQSSTFKDNSTNNLTITVTGTPTISSGGPAIAIGGGKPVQGTFSPFSTTGWSYYVPVNNYLSAASNSAFSLAGVFTVEFWVNFTTAIGTGTITGVAAAGAFNIYNDGTRIGPNLYGTGNIFNSTFLTASIVQGKWYHIVVSRNASNLMTMYVDGVSVGSTTTATTYTAGAWRIGDGVIWSGYVSNLRITNTDVYGGSVIVPTSPLTAVSGTQLLTCQSNKFVDNSINNIAITVTAGTPKVQPFSPFAPTSSYSTSSTGGSIYFNGSSDYITTNADAAFGTGDFTIEFWAYFNSVAGTQDLFDTRPAGTASTPQYVAIETVSGALNYYTNNANPAISGGTLVAGTWYHIALSRSGTSTRMFINGVQTGSTYSDSQNYVNGANRPALGIDSNLLNTSYFNGYMSNIKVIKGKALYTTTFTPPTSPATTSDAPILLLNATNSGIIDQTGKNNITTYGSVSVSSTQSKFGGTSISLNGTTDYLAISGIPNLFNFGTADFTVEAWIYLTDTANSQFLIDTNTSGDTTTTTPFRVRVVPITGGFGLDMVDQSGTRISGLVSTGNPMSLNIWNHVAIVSINGIVTFFHNGLISSTSTIHGLSFYCTANNRPVIGINGSNQNANYFPGFIDELRVTRYARYSSFSSSNTSATALLVGGGGGGGYGRVGNHNPGGGGSGGVLYSTINLDNAATYTIIVGAGGGPNINGTNTSIVVLNAGLNAIGGGAGGGNSSSPTNGNNGGSGGGGAGSGAGTVRAGGTGLQPTSTNGGLGNNGGQGVGPGHGGGGGGAGTAGVNAVGSTSAGPGGDGTSTYSSILSTASQGVNIAGTYYVAAGGGGGGSTTTGGNSGLLGGNSAISSPVTAASSGKSFTGTGGGGGAATSGVETGGNGGSGLVIITYVGQPVFAGGTITTSGSNTYHTFTSSGTLSNSSLATTVINYPTSVFPDQ
jgi:hypothetical protein